MDEKTKKEIRKLRQTSKFAYAGSVDAEGFPQVKCMFNIKSDNMTEHYFWSNTGSKRAAQYKENPKASVYYCDETWFKGALFTGVMEVCTDEETKARFWEKSCERYYTSIRPRLLHIEIHRRKGELLPWVKQYDILPS